MTVYDLTKDEKRELKSNYLASKEERDLSYSELADIDLLISDSEIEDVYCDTYFSPDDFFCNEGLKTEWKKKL